MAELVVAAVPGQAQAPTGQPQAVSSQEAIAAAADSSGATPLRARAAALRVLGVSCPREALPMLTALAQPYRREWVIWHGALKALSECPYEDLAPFWREMITFPRRPVREVAIVGLLRTGSRGDIELIREATHRERDPVIRRLAERADSLLRLPPAQRAAALPR